MFKFEAAPQKIFIISVRALIVNKALGVSVQLPVDPTHSLETLRGAQIAISLSQPHRWVSIMQKRYHSLTLTPHH